MKQNSCLVVGEVAKPTRIGFDFLDDGVCKEFDLMWVVRFIAINLAV